MLSFVVRGLVWSLRSLLVSLVLFGLFGSLWPLCDTKNVILNEVKNLSDSTTVNPHTDLEILRCAQDDIIQR